MKNRRLSREAAMEIIFSGQENELNEQGDFLEDLSSMKETDRKLLDDKYIAKVICEYTAHKEETEKSISENLKKGWNMDRISRTDKSILALAVTEMLYLGDSDIPPAVSINEAIELTRKFSGEESVKFVNSVLDKIKKNMAEKETDTDIDNEKTPKEEVLSDADENQLSAE